MEQKVIDRFWTKVDKNGPIHPTLGTRCWLWTAGLRNGYGGFRFPTHSDKAHRVSWRIHFGEIPESDDYHGTCVRHKCANRKCVNPEHLELGTVGDNNRDTVRHGAFVCWAKENSDLMPRGVENSQAVLDDDKVREIRRLYAQGGVTQTELGDRFGVDNTTISCVVTRRTWKHVL